MKRKGILQRIMSIRLFLGWDQLLPGVSAGSLAFNVSPEIVHIFKYLIVALTLYIQTSAKG